jgi:hypothetical protein
MVDSVSLGCVAGSICFFIVLFAGLFRSTGRRFEGHLSTGGQAVFLFAKSRVLLLFALAPSLALESRGGSCGAFLLFSHLGAVLSTSERQRMGNRWASDQEDNFWEEGLWASIFVVVLLSSSAGLYVLIRFCTKGIGMAGNGSEHNSFNFSRISFRFM